MGTPMRVTKDEAKQIVATYKDLLLHRGVISDISEENIRGEQHYEFTIHDEDLGFPFPVECVGVKELAIVLRAMWLTYQKVYTELTVY